MRILITNDDGIQASGLIPLVKWAMKLGQVTVIAPKVEQSGKSHGIEIHKSFSLEQVDLVDGVEAYALDSTPADCVRYAILGRKDKYDLVISGINRGLNVGADIMYSGTVGAICEAANLGVHALAFSTTPAYYDKAVEHLDMAYDFVQEHKLLEKNLFYNINIPAQPTGIRITRQGGPYYSDEFTLRDGMVYPHGIDVFQACGSEDVDTDCVLRCGMISITPMTNQRANMPLFEELKALNG
jgi:5'-nucleotidase